jgi:hypothetical protein
MRHTNNGGGTRIVATKKRRLDIHIDFQFTKEPKTSNASSDEVLEHIDSYIRSQLKGFPIRVTNISWERKDEEAGRMHTPDYLEE